MSEGWCDICGNDDCRHYEPLEILRKDIKELKEQLSKKPTRDELIAGIQTIVNYNDTENYITPLLKNLINKDKGE